MVEHLPIERRSAEAEVRRYCAWPTYQLCYAVGRRELLQLARGLPRGGGRRLRSAAVPRCAAGVRRPARLAGALGDGPRRVGRSRGGAPVKITVLTYLDSENENSKDYDPVVPQVARDAPPPGTPGVGPRRPRRRQAAHRRPLAPEARSRLQPDGDVRRQRLRRHPGHRPARAARASATPAAGPASCTSARTRGSPRSSWPSRTSSIPRYAVFSRQAGVRDRRQPPDAAVREAAPLRRLARHRRQVAGARRGGADGAGRRDPQGAGGFGAGRGVHRRARVLRRRARATAQPKALPPIEVDFTGFPEGVPKVMDSKAKWDERSKEYKGTKSVIADPARRAPRPAPEGGGRRLPRAPGARTTAGWTSGSPTPARSTCSRSTRAATSRSRASSPWRPAASGLDYPRLIERIVNLASERFERKRR